MGMKRCVTITRRTITTRGAYKSILQKRFEFQTRSIIIEGIKNKLLPISKEKNPNSTR
jgi:hypothetical protein